MFYPYSVHSLLHLIIDFDGVVYNLVERFAALVDLKRGNSDASRWVKRQGREIDWNFFEEFGISNDEFVELLADGFRSGHFSEGKPLPGAIDGLRALSEAENIVVHVVTKRSIPGAEFEALLATQCWLKSFGVLPDHLTSLGASEPKDCDQVRAMIREGFTVVTLDDSLENIEVFAAAGWRSVAMDYRHNRSWPGERVDSVSELARRLGALAK